MNIFVTKDRSAEPETCSACICKFAAIMTEDKNISEENPEEQIPNPGEEGK
jgi:hypothetical protein